MAIQVADNFSYQGKKPLDARVQFNTLANMVATSADILYDGCLAYVKGDKKYYTYDSSNDVDETLGKWRELETDTSDEYISKSQKGANGGVAELDSSGKVPSSQLPSYVDDVKTYPTKSDFPAEGEDDKIYIAKDENASYRWDGEDYVSISSANGLTLGETSSTAYRGDRGKIAYEDSQTNKTAIGTLANLTTTEKTNLVGAINEIDNALDGKVNAVTGKGLSTNDYTDAEKQKVTNAQPKTLATSKTIEGASVTTVQGVADAVQTHTDKTVLSANGVHGLKVDTSEDKDKLYYKDGNNWVEIETGSTIQLEELPIASADNVGDIYQYIGDTTSTLKQGYFYQCVNDGGTYKWFAIQVQAAGGQTIQYAVMPEAGVTFNDKIIQYTGESTQTYTNGYFYKCVAKGTDPETYAWEQTNIQPTSEGMSYEVVTELPTQNIDTETMYALKPSKNEIISDGNARSISLPYGTASVSESYHSSFDIEAGTVLDISVTLSKINANVPSCRIDIVINGVSTTIANGITTGTTSTISARHTLNDDFVAERDTFDIVVEHTQYAGDATVDIGTLSILGYVPKKEYDYEYYLNTDGTSDGWKQIALSGEGGGSEGDERIKPEITEMGVVFNDGFRPYYNVNLSTIVPSFSELSLSDLAIIMDGYYSGEIPLNALKEAWSVGDSISIDISAMSADGVGESHPMQTVDLTIVDFDKHTLATPIDSITRAGLVLGFQLAEKGYYHSSANTSNWGYSDMSGGWEGCARRTWCNSTLFNAMPNEFQNMIKPVIKSYDTGVYMSGQAEKYLYSEVTDKIFIPSINEYIGRTITNAEADNRNVVPASIGSQYKLYETQQLITDNAMTSTSVYISGGSGANTHFYLQLATPLGGASYAFQDTNQIIAPHVCI